MAEYFGRDLLLLDRLAAGGMAEVYRAKQSGTGGFEKIVAIKRILPHFAQSDEFKSMFRDEAVLTAKLQHPNIVQVFANGEHQNYLYLVLEFVDGKNLRQVLARSEKNKIKIPIDIACFIACEVAKGLDYAHSFVDDMSGQSMDIVHRDMSPQNVMVSYHGAVKIVDFGIAKVEANNPDKEHTRAGVLKGKFGYMSPEQANGDTVDKRTDIFALGIVLHEMLTMKRLFTADDDLKTLQFVRDCNVPRPSKYNPNIPSQLDTIVMKMLAKNKSERYSSAAELHKDLSSFLNQKFPQFVHSDLSNFTKKLFEEDIVEEKRKRDKILAEAPARVHEPEHEKQKSEDSGMATQISSESDKTKVGDTSSFGIGMKTDGQVSLTAPSTIQSVADPVRQLSVNEEMSSEGKTSPGLVLNTNPNYKQQTKTPATPSVARRQQSVGSVEKPKNYFRLILVAGVALVFAWLFVSQEQAPQQGSKPASIETPKTDIASSEPVTQPVSEPVTEEPAQAPASALSPWDEYLKKVEGILLTAEQDKSKAGKISLSSSPAANEVYINGILIRDSQTQAPLRLERKIVLDIWPGTYEVILKNTLFGVQYREQISIERERIINLEPILTK